MSVFVVRALVIVILFCFIGCYGIIITSLFVVSIMELLIMSTQDCNAYIVLKKLQIKKLYETEGQKIVVYC